MSFSGELRSIYKSFGPVQANRDVNLKIHASTIHALVGENGAGKSTAMKMLFGLLRPDQGQILFSGNDVTQGWSPQRAFHLGLGMVHQHFMLAEPETVLDNLVLGVERRGFAGLRNRKQERAELNALMEKTGLEVPLDKRLGDLPVGLQSRCEILKVLHRKAKFLILDEPTAVLTPQEIEDFLNTLRALKDQGHTILIVTHKLKEVMAVSDDVTVMRAGQTVAARATRETNIPELSELIVGRKVVLPKTHARENEGQRRAALACSDYSLELKAGQITGIAGCEGNGQELLVERIIHANWHANRHAHRSKLDGCALELFGQDASTSSPNDLRKKPIAIIPADRHKEGLVLGFSLTENLRLGRENYGKRAWDFFGAASENEKKLLKDFDVRPSDPLSKASALSGGNQQKVIVAREIGELENNSFVIAVHPTRGVDIGAIELIHGRLLKAAENGAAVLLISSELDELMALSHRIGVMYRGKIAKWFAGPAYDEKALGLTMLSGEHS